jgi:hypothetical protein
VLSDPSALAAVCLRSEVGGRCCDAPPSTRARSARLIRAPPRQTTDQAAAAGVRYQRVIALAERLTKERQDDNTDGNPVELTGTIAEMKQATDLKVAFVEAPPAKQLQVTAWVMVALLMRRHGKTEREIHTGMKKAIGIDGPLGVLSEEQVGSVCTWLEAQVNLDA